MPKFKVTKHTDSGLRGDVSCLTAEINGQVQTLVSDGGRGFLVCECKVYQGVWHRGEWHQSTT